jgi:hypothetical protein
MTPRCFNYSLGFASAISLVITIVGVGILPQPADTKTYSYNVQDAQQNSSNAYTNQITHSTGFAMVMTGTGVILMCLGAFMYSRHRREMTSLVIRTQTQPEPEPLARPVPLEETGPPPKIIIRPQTAIITKQKTRRSLIQIV